MKIKELTYLRQSLEVVAIGAIKEMDVLNSGKTCKDCSHCIVERFIPRCLLKKKAINLHSYCKELHHEPTRDSIKKETKLPTPSYYLFKR